MRDLSQYFHPRKFIHNNINFRIKTSEAIYRFKLDQSFILNQMINNNRFEFSPLSRDIMLLKYDVWYDWINEIEQLLLQSKEDIPTIKTTTKELSKDRKIYYENTLRDNFDDEDLEYINFWIDSHEEVYNLLEKKISDIREDISKEDMFIEITRITSNIMKRTLYELQEIESLFFDRGDVNICVDNICVEIFKNDINIFRNKIESFLKIKPINRVVIKNYSDIDGLELFCEQAINILNERNIDFYII